ncbi:unnamed protein product [Lathyrus sativus]|nr:unnamed protein product [Lathyrus sativus]
MNLEQDFIPFVKWLVNYFINKKQEEILVLQRPWENIRGEIMESPFPPEQTISLSQNTEVTPYLSLPLQRVEQSQVTLKELNSVIRSQNYTNAYLVFLGEQFISMEKDLLSIKDLLEKQIERQNIIIDHINKPKDQISTSTISDVPIVQPPVSIEGFKMETNGEEFVRILEQKLKGLNITVMSHEDYSKDNNDNHIDF